MNFRKVKYCPCVLFLIVLMLVGCGGDDDDWGDQSQRTQRDYVQGAISKIMTRMHCTGDIAGEIRTRRSLAQYILKDHFDLMAYFQSKQWEEIEPVMGDEVKLYTFDSEGNQVPWAGKINEFWAKMYKEKAQACSMAASIELELEVTHVTLEDVDNPSPTLNCKSMEFFEFHVVCRDMKGRIISNQSGGGSTGRDHSEDCPWN